MTVARILGIGSPFGDDRIGWEVIEAVHASGLLARFPAGSVAAECCDRPGSRLIASLRGADLVIVIDAMQTGAAAGTVRRLPADEIESVPGLLSSHGFGLADALALARALGTMPSRLVIIGVELSRTGPGDGLSAAMQAAIPGVVRQIGAELAQAQGKFLTEAPQAPAADSNLAESSAAP